MHIALRWLVFLLPTGLLALDAVHASAEHQFLLLVGAGASGLVAFLLLVALKGIPPVRVTCVVGPLFTLPWLLIFPPAPGYEGQRAMIEAALIALPVLGVGLYWLERLRGADVSPGAATE